MDGAAGTVSNANTGTTATLATRTESERTEGSFRAAVETMVERLEAVERCSVFTGT